MSSPTDFRLGYRRWLDGLRGVAVLLVLAVHLNLVRGGYLGVDVFFVLSGFLITALLIEEHQRTGAIRFRRFYFRRALRLLPAFVLTLLFASAIVRAFYPVQAKAFVKELLVAACYVMNWQTLHRVQSVWLQHTWSLAVEEQFYLIWPPLLWLMLRARMSKRAILTAVVLGILASAGARAWLALHAPPQGDPRRVTAFWRLSTGLDTRADALLLGCLAGLLVGWGLLPRAAWFPRLLRAAGLCALVGVGLCVCLCPAPWVCVAMPLGLFTAVDLGAAVFLLCVLRAPLPGVRRALEFGPLVGVGRISYGLYLFHYPAFVFLLHRSQGKLTPRVLLLTVALSFAAALLSYFLVERPLLRLKRREAAVPAPTPAPARAA
jgi:peptidoglycan/LPS O-acetylase OafA/YrhL